MKAEDVKPGMKFLDKSRECPDKMPNHVRLEHMAHGRALVSGYHGSEWVLLVDLVAEGDYDPKRKTGARFSPAE